MQKAKLFYVKNFIMKNKKSQRPTVEIPAKPETFDNGIPKDTVQYLVTIGTWAPSADNCQPWQFKWDGNTLSLMKDPDKCGFFYDVNQESTFLTFGALIENIKIGATYFGLKANINLFPEGYGDTLIARIKFIDENERQDPLFPFILDRFVNREIYNKEPIDPTIVKELRDGFSSSKTTDIVWIDNENDKKIINTIVYDADRILFEDERLHNGLFKWINFKNGQKKDGMDIDVLGLNLFQKQLFPLLADWSKLKKMNKLGMSWIPGLTSLKLLKSSSAYAIIKISNNDPETYIEGGQMMERFWIAANRMGLSVQPMAGFVFLLNHLISDNVNQFKSDHQVIIKGFRKKLNSITGLDGSLRLVMFFRIGISDKQSHRTKRIAHNIFF